LPHGLTYLPAHALAAGQEAFQKFLFLAFVGQSFGNGLSHPVEHIGGAVSRPGKKVHHFVAFTRFPVAQGPVQHIDQFP